ncbi:MAG: 30S ribosomal protein S19 [Candidatus Pacearchaeota archaeon]
MVKERKVEKIEKVEAIEFRFRNKTIDELRQMSLKDFALFVKSRERRSLLRQLDRYVLFLKQIKEKAEKGKPIRTHWRDAVIIPALVGLTIYVHNGKSFEPVKITEEMLGHRLGEFVLTRKPVKHSAPGVGATKSSAFLSVK